LASVSGNQRSFGGLSDQGSNRLGKVLSIVEQKDPARPPLHEKGDQRGIRLSRVTIAAGENQVVGPIIGRLPPPGADVIQRDRVLSGLGAAIGANRAVLSEQPITVRLHGTTRGTTETRD
jgi:hypothetical protein